MFHFYSPRAIYMGEAVMWSDLNRVALQARAGRPRTATDLAVCKYELWLSMYGRTCKLS